MVINNYVPLIIVLCVFVVIPFGIALKSGDFKVMKTSVSPNLVYFFLALGLIIVSLPFYLIAKKKPQAIEFIIPSYAIYATLFLLPTWIESPRSPTLIAKSSLLQANHFLYICHMINALFFSSHYSVSCAARALLCANNFNMSLRRFLTGDSELLP